MKSEFTQAIINEINILKGKTKTMNSLVKIINNKYGTDFNLTQVKYQVDKLLQQTFGCADEDVIYPWLMLL